METKKIILAVVILAAIIIVPSALLIYQQILTAGTVKVQIIKAPREATVTIGDNPANGKTVNLKPGTYRYTIEHEGFDEISDILTVHEKSVYQPSIVAQLQPNSPEGGALFDARQSDYGEVERATAELARKNGEAFKELNPITSELPFTNLLFTIGHRADPADSSGNSIILTITAPDIYRHAAIQQIRNWGYDPVDYKIEINGEENPFL